MAEFICKDLVAKAGREKDFYICSAATSSEEIGNPVYPPAVRELFRHGISCVGKRARRITKEDYQNFDLLIGMEESNIRNMLRFYGGDPEHKIKKLLSYTKEGRDIADPWYTGEFSVTYDEILYGCTELLKTL